MRPIIMIVSDEDIADSTKALECLVSMNECPVNDRELYGTAAVTFAILAAAQTGVSAVSTFYPREHS